MGFTDKGVQVNGAQYGIESFFEKFMPTAPSSASRRAR
jgi:hypothetical protein